MCPRGGGESVSNWHFLVVVPQTIGFCILQKQANRSTWFIFPRLILTSCLDTTWKNAASILQFICSGRAEAKGWWKWGLWPTVERVKKLYSRLSERNIGQMPMYCEIFTRGTWWSNENSFEFSVVHVGMYDIVDVCSVHLSEHFASNPIITLKIVFHYTSVCWRVGSSGLLHQLIYLF